MQHYFEDLVPVQVRLRYSFDYSIHYRYTNHVLLKGVLQHTTQALSVLRNLSLKWSLHNLK